jgi:hypothetical protein
VPENFAYHPFTGGGAPEKGTAAQQMFPDVCPSQFMTVYGQSLRNALPGPPPEPSLTQALHMWAGSTYTSKISAAGGRLESLIRSGKSDTEIIDEFYLSALSRWPTAREKEGVSRILLTRSPQRRRATLEDFVWALISSREFAYNH